ncbi:8-amino-7-oxononanoate synthase [Pragia fontium]|uniref:8-amino-7-oxononanoate synthase n=1 Tax=Pragia fontium DSM 5563 = ATCC 49100 TaxID=1122977 RepID=A0AAJ4WAU8_9GAMM|nr:8-amino-7-oxononanoate synthase [Pragia fontium]SFC87989.1 8-amino-7-oxononanoate synthase [Pragia fontium DSM 5563 = ATCC 49100]VEJ56053.1 8-amino-7-oxononanoate synthase [Pragia fontium]
MSFQHRIEQGLAERRAADAYRRRAVSQSGSGREISLNGQRYLNFSSNDYLGLSRDPTVIRAWQSGAERYGVGSAGSGHVTGFTTAHAELEQQLADWLGYPRALLFISGYAANQAVIAALMQNNDRILADKFSHASLIEASMHSPATLRRFQHNQPTSLDKLLQAEHSGQTLAITEGVFSMDGDSAPLAALHHACQQAGAWLMVDDAHGIGVNGSQGRGTCAAQKVKPELLVITFGKAFGLSGAAVLCSESVAEYFIQFARHLIYSTSMPPAQACALSAALQRVIAGDDLRQQLQQNITQFRNGLAGSGLQLMNSQSAIQPVLVGENQAAIDLARHLSEQGIWTSAIRPPTVPPDTARLRITLSAVHHEQDINHLLEVLNAVTATQGE